MEGSWLEPNIWRLLQFMQFDLNVTEVLGLICSFEHGLNTGVSSDLQHVAAAHYLVWNR